MVTLRTRFVADWASWVGSAMGAAVEGTRSASTRPMALFRAHDVQAPQAYTDWQRLLAPPRTDRAAKPANTAVIRKKDRITVTTSCRCGSKSSSGAHDLQAGA